MKDKNNKIKVTIIVPVYNVEAYIERCFESITKQSYKNIECIFIDDASPDKSRMMLERMIYEYYGGVEFKILSHSENKGLSAARNTGTLAATGKYIYYLDSDDEIVDNCIELLMSMVYKYPDVEVVQGNTMTIPVPENDWRNIEKKGYPEYVNDNQWLIKRFLGEPRIPVNAWNKLIRKSFVLDNSLLFYDGVIHEDVHWVYYVAKKITSISFVKEICYIHYIVPGSIMQDGNAYRSIKSMLVIIQDMMRNISGPCVEMQKKYIYGLFGLNIVRIDIEKMKDLYELYREFIREQVLYSFASVKIVDCLFFCVYMMPISVYKSFMGRKLSNLFIKLL